MAVTKRTVVVAVTVELDGQVTVFEQEEYWEGGIQNGVLEATSPKRGRRIDVGDDATAEDDLIKDVINGNLHSQARKDARDAAKAAR